MRCAGPSRWLGQGLQVAQKAALLPLLCCSGPSPCLPVTRAPLLPPSIHAGSPVEQKGCAPAAVTVVLCWAFRAESAAGRCSRTDVASSATTDCSSISPEVRVGQGLPCSHLCCSIVAPRSRQAAKGNGREEGSREEGSHTEPQLHTDLRAKRCLLVEIAPHKFTILPGGYFTPGGGTSDQTEEQVTCGRHNGPSCALSPVPRLIPRLPMRADAFSCLTAVVSLQQTRPYLSL